ncbi:hypothetical protein BY458DRAFT_515890 [Sporodiniella umbellata]|nr:hypothetical protein BY458DRAFT_515890 [Sporodiniella umbellata]
MSFPSQNGDNSIIPGTIIFTSGQNRKSDFWDDSELIDHWDKTVELYRNQLSNNKRENPQNSEFPRTKRKKETKKTKVVYKVKAYTKSLWVLLIVH